MVYTQMEIAMFPSLWSLKRWRAEKLMLPMSLMRLRREFLLKERREF